MTDTTIARIQSLKSEISALEQLPQNRRIKALLSMKKQELSSLQIHDHAITMMGLEHDSATGEYFSIWGQYAQPELVGTRKITTIEEIKKDMNFMDRQIAIYGCE